MSKAAIGQALELLQQLPDSDQQAVLQFLKSLKNRGGGSSQTIPSPANPALKNVNALLVFTGEINDPNIDWLKIIREERHNEILHSPASHNAAK